MKLIKILIVLLFVTGTMYGQPKRKGKLNYIKTSYSVELNKINYSIYQYKTGEYFTIQTDKRNGRIYWQPLTRVKQRSNKQKRGKQTPQRLKR
jgi:hypothetical protein